MKPQRKVVAGGLAGSIVSLVVWILHLNGIEVPAEQAVSILTIITFIVAYAVPNAPETPPNA